MELDEIIGYFQAVAEAFEGNCQVTPTEDEYAMIAAIPWLRKAKEMCGEEWNDTLFCQKCPGSVRIVSHIDGPSLYCLEDTCEVDVTPVEVRWRFREGT